MDHWQSFPEEEFCCPNISRNVNKQSPELVPSENLEDRPRNRTALLGVWLLVMLVYCIVSLFFAVHIIVVVQR